MKRGLIIRVLAVGAVLLCPLAPGFGQTAEEITKEKILATGKEWQDRYAQYNPEADMVEALNTKVGAETRIDVYLGLWCKDSRNHLPPFIKILDRLAGAVPVRYFSVPRKVGKDVKYFVEELKVERVPTFIFYRGGAEVGRIVENPKIGMIEDFMEIVFKQ